MDAGHGNQFRKHLQASFSRQVLRPLVLESFAVSFRFFDKPLRGGSKFSKNIR